MINPQEGFIVTANQNIASRGGQPDLAYGKQGLPPYRALRIREMILQLKAADKRVSFDQLSKIQIDSVSIEARELAPTLGRLCEEQFKKSNASRRTFAQEIAQFDGNYSIESRAALPFEMMLHQITKKKLGEFVGPEEANHTFISEVNYKITNALYKEIQGHKTSIFADSDGKSWESQVKESCEPAYQALVAKSGQAPWKWRWGRHHYLYRQSPIAQAPAIGSFFRDKKREVAGTFASPLAEGGIPVRLGANLRLKVKMKSPPEIHMILDNGNSGLPGHQNALDQADLWHKGETRQLNTDWQKAKSEAKLYFELDRF